MLVKWLSYKGNDDYKSIQMTGRTPPTENAPRRNIKLSEMRRTKSGVNEEDRIAIEEQPEFALDNAVKADTVDVGSAGTH